MSQMSYLGLTFYTIKKIVYQKRINCFPILLLIKSKLKGKYKI